MMEDAATSPGSSSSSSSADVIVPQRQFLGVQHLTRQEIAEQLSGAVETDMPCFIDEIAAAHALLREGKDPVSNHRPCKRIRVKTSSESLLLPVVAAHTELGPSDDEAEEGVPEWQVTKHARSRYASKVARARNKLDGSKYVAAYNKAYAGWGELSAAERQQHIDAYKGMGITITCPRFGNNTPTTRRLDPETMNGPQFSCGVLVTWNGPWFLSDPVYVDLVKEWHDVPHLLVAHVLQYPGIQEMFEEVRRLMLSTKDKFKLREWSCCIELSLEAADLGRLHIHAFLERNCREDGTYATWMSVLNCMKFRGIPVSHYVPAAVKTRGRNRTRALTEGHYYCQAEKIGQLINDSSVRKFVKLFPDVRMIVALWRHRKMTTGVCKMEALWSRDRVPTTWTMLDATMALEYSAEQEREAATADTVWKSMPFKEPSLGEREWLAQHCILASKPSLRQYRAGKYVSLQDAAAARNLRRCKFIIYDGPSRMGKTELACSWFGTINTLVCNAQDCTTPNMRPILSGKYSAVLFDEGDWQLCFQNKTMMQASSRTVELGQSQCNDRSYQVLLYKVPLIVCSNDFWGGCNNIAAKEWIQLNSIYIRVDSEVWVKPGEAVS